MQEKLLKFYAKALTLEAGSMQYKDQEVMGFIGLETIGNYYTKIEYSILSKAFGIFRGLWS